MSRKQLFFSNEDLDEQFARTVFASYYGAADLGEAFATAQQIGNDKADTWYQQWRARADQVRTDAEASHTAGHLTSAREGYLRASEYYRQAFYFIRSDIGDARLLDAYQAHCTTFAHAAQLMRTPALEVAVPYRDEAGDKTIHGWFFSPDDQDVRRPTVVSPCGYDSTAESGWVYVQSALDRGYNVLSIEGPGQGRSLYLDGVVFRPDSEFYLSQVMDWLIAQPRVDANRIAMIGRSFAGYLGPRAVANDSRYAALVCDPAQPDMGDKIPGGLVGKIAAPLMATASHLSAGKAEFFGSRMAAHGDTTIDEYFATLKTFTMIDQAGQIACPTLIVESDGDPVGGSGQKLYDAIGSETKELIAPPASSGLSGHCGGLGQRVWGRMVFDWLDAAMRPTQVGSAAIDS